MLAQGQFKGHNEVASGWGAGIAKVSLRTGNLLVQLFESPPRVVREFCIGTVFILSTVKINVRSQQLPMRKRDVSVVWHMFYRLLYK